MLLVLGVSSCHPSSEAWKENLEKASLAKSQKNFDSAVKLYKATVKQMEELNESAKIQIPVLNKLIVLLLEQKKNKEAFSYAEKALRYAERAYGPDHINVMPQLVLAEKAASRLHDREKADSYMNRMIELQEKESGNDSVPVMWLLDQYARSKSPSCGDKFDSEKLRHLVRLREKFAALDSLDTIQDKVILASVLSQEGKADEAATIFDYCVKVSREKYPGYLPEAELQYAKALKKTKQNEKAILLLKDAYKIAGPGKRYNLVLAPDIASELGFLLASQNRNAEAALIYKEMIEKFKSSGASLDRLASFEQKLQDLSPAHTTK